MLRLFNRNMNSKVDTNIYLVIILVLAALICYFEPYVIPVMVAIVLVTYYFSRRTLMNKEIFFSGYLDNIIRNIERTNYFAVQKLNIGMAVFSRDGKLQWKNNLFQTWVDKKNLEGMRLEEVLPLPANAFDLMSVHDGEQLLQLTGRYYNLRHCLVQTMEKAPVKGPTNQASGLMLYMTDITEFELLLQKYESDKLCLAYVRFDNYEDVMRGLSEANVANLSGEVNERIAKWVGENSGFLCRMIKELSLVGFNQASVAHLMENKFDILDKIREIHSGNKIQPTVSLGMSCDGVTLEEFIQTANKALYLALGRGGDQAVVIQNKSTQFFGGTSTVNAKSTRVRARIVAQTMRDSIRVRPLRACVCWRRKLSRLVAVSITVSVCSI